MRNEDEVVFEGFFPYRDTIIDDFAKKGERVETIIKRIKNGKCFDEKWIVRHFNELVLLFEEKEAEWDIKIMDEIKSLYRTEKLFYDYYHPSEKVLDIICEKILKVLGIKDLNIKSDFAISAFRSACASRGCKNSWTRMVERRIYHKRQIDSKNE